MASDTHIDYGPTKIVAVTIDNCLFQRHLGKLSVLQRNATHDDNPLLTRIGRRPVTGCGSSFGRSVGILGNQGSGSSANEVLSGKSGCSAALATAAQPGIGHSSRRSLYLHGTQLPSAAPGGRGYPLLRNGAFGERLGEQVDHQ